MKKIAWWLLGLLAIFAFGGCTAAGGTEVPLAASLAGVMTEGLALETTPIENATFTTKYNEKIKNRTTNVKLAAKTIDGMVIHPGDVFSFNEALGDTTSAKGYKRAKIFVKGKEEQGVGGGICQVSSTLFNAADFAGMEIIERHDHSKKVDYVELGRDAATSYGGVDLKFRNTLPHSVIIVAHADNGELTVSLETVSN